MPDRPSHLTAVPADAETLLPFDQTPDPDDDDAPYVMLGRDDLDGRMRSAIEAVADWYHQAEAARTEDDSFYWGRQLYHVMRPIEALDRKLRGLPPEQPCTTCGTEEGGASSGPDGNGGRFSLCAWCANDADQERRNG